MSERIYLDNAATSWPKAPGVATSMTQYLEENGAPAGRGGYAEASEVQQLLQDCRRRLANLIGAEHPDRVVMAFNGTDALNIAIHGLLRPGDHVVTSTLEHNSVLRPLQHWTSGHGVEVTHLSPDAGGLVTSQSLERALRPETRLAILTHASNVTGVVQPVDAWGQVLQQHSAMFLVDAAQTLGHLECDARAMGADVLAASTHKGIRGPLGTAMLYVGPRAEREMQPWRQGGTGVKSEELEQPAELPHRLESGNLNMVGIVGLRQALLSQGSLQERQDRTIHEHILTQQLIEGLKDVPQCVLRGSHHEAPPAVGRRTPVVSVTVEGFDPQELAAPAGCHISNSNTSGAFTALLSLIESWGHWLAARCDSA